MLRNRWKKGGGFVTRTFVLITNWNPKVLVPENNMFLVKNNDTSARTHEKIIWIGCIMDKNFQNQQNQRILTTSVKICTRLTSINCQKSEKSWHFYLKYTKILAKTRTFVLSPTWYPKIRDSRTFNKKSWSKTPPRFSGNFSLNFENIDV